MDQRISNVGFGDFDAPHEDLREWLKRVDEIGELKVIEGADWNLEIGAIAEMIYHANPENAPALLFKNIPGYPKGFRALSGATNSAKRLAIILGFPVPSHPLDLVRGYRDRM